MNRYLPAVFAFVAFPLAGCMAGPEDAPSDRELAEASDELSFGHDISGSEFVPDLVEVREPHGEPVPRPDATLAEFIEKNEGLSFDALDALEGHQSARADYMSSLRSARADYMNSLGVSSDDFQIDLPTAAADYVNEQSVFELGGGGAIDKMDVQLNIPGERAKSVGNDDVDGVPHLPLKPCADEGSMCNRTRICAETGVGLYCVPSAS